MTLRDWNRFARVDSDSTLKTHTSKIKRSSSQTKTTLFERTKLPFTMLQSFVSPFFSSSSRSIETDASQPSRHCCCQMRLILKAWEKSYAIGRITISLWLVWTEGGQHSGASVENVRRDVSSPKRHNNGAEINCTMSWISEKILFIFRCCYDRLRIGYKENFSCLL